MIELHLREAAVLFRLPLAVDVERCWHACPFSSRAACAPGSGAGRRLTFTLNCSVAWPASRRRSHLDLLEAVVLQPAFRRSSRSMDDLHQLRLLLGRADREEAALRPCSALRSRDEHLLDRQVGQSLRAADGSVCAVAGTWASSDIAAVAVAIGDPVRTVLPPSTWRRAVRLRRSSIPSGGLRSSSPQAGDADGLVRVGRRRRCRRRSRCSGPEASRGRGTRRCPSTVRTTVAVNQ